jgi:hypothetical protein
MLQSSLRSYEQGSPVAAGVLPRRVTLVCRGLPLHGLVLKRLSPPKKKKGDSPVDALDPSVLTGSETCRNMDIAFIGT